MPACTVCERADRAVRNRSGVIICRRCAARQWLICSTRDRPRLRSSAAADDRCLQCGELGVRRCPRCAGDELTLAGGVAACRSCQYRQLLEKYLATTDPRRQQELHPLLDRLRSEPFPMAERLLYGQTAGPRAFRDLLSGSLEMSHESLDSVTDGSTRIVIVNYLRRLLVDAGALPDRDEHLHRSRRKLTADRDNPDQFCADAQPILPLTPSATAPASDHHRRRKRQRRPRTGYQAPRNAPRSELAQRSRGCTRGRQSGADRALVR